MLIIPSVHLLTHLPSDPSFLRQAHEAALAALLSQHVAELSSVRSEAAAREAELQGGAVRLEGANATLTKAKAALETEEKVGGWLQGWGTFRKARHLASWLWAQLKPDPSTTLYP